MAARRVRSLVNRKRVMQVPFLVLAFVLPAMCVVSASLVYDARLAVLWRMLLPYPETWRTELTSEQWNRPPYDDIRANYILTNKAIAKHEEAGIEVALIGCRFSQERSEFVLRLGGKNSQHQVTAVSAAITDLVSNKAWPLNHSFGRGGSFEDSWAWEQYMWSDRTFSLPGNKFVIKIESIQFERFWKTRLPWSFMYYYQGGPWLLEFDSISCH